MIPEATGPGRKVRQPSKPVPKSASSPLNLLSTRAPHAKSSSLSYLMAIPKRETTTGNAQRQHGTRRDSPFITVIQWGQSYTTHLSQADPTLCRWRQRDCAPDLHFFPSSDPWHNVMPFPTCLCTPSYHLQTGSNSLKAKLQHHKRLS